MMKYNKTSLMIVSFMTYMIMAGLLTQTGIIIGPMSKYLNISITSSASIFSYLTGGTLIGTFISMIAYSKYDLKKILRLNYVVFIVVLVAMISLNFKNIVAISLYLIVIGACCGIGLSGGAVLISKIFDEDKRASAFIATDCAFSASGFIFPTIATFIIYKNIEWTMSYAPIGLIALFVFFSTFIFKYPQKNKVKKISENLQEQKRPFNIKNIMTPRVLLIGLSLCLYLFAQNTFLTWSPNYLQEIFGLTPVDAGSVVGKYWGTSVFGLIAAAILVNKFSARYMLITIILIAIFLVIFLSITNSAEHFLTITIFFGFFTSCIYKLSISVGSQQIKGSPAILITFLLTCGTVGSTIAPALSAVIIENFGISSAMLVTTISFIAVFILVLTCLIIENKQTIKN